MLYNKSIKNEIELLKFNFCFLCPLLLEVLFYKLVKVVLNVFKLLQYFFFIVKDIIKKLILKKYLTFIFEYAIIRA